MTEKNTAFADLVKRLAEARSFLFVTHARPDGDGLGSMAAMAAAARSAGKGAEMLVPETETTVPRRYEFLFAAGRPAVAARFDALAADAGAIVILDTCALAQLDGLAESLRRHRDKTVVIDHHATRDDIGAVQWVDTSAAATGVMAAELIEALGWSSDLQVAEALATAITSDTGWLRFANTSVRCLRVFAELVAAGVRPDRLYAKLYQTDRPQRLRLLARALGRLELHCDGRLAVMTIRRDDFEATGAAGDETENFVNEALRIGSVESAVLLVENTGCVRASLRSRDGVDVAALAGRFGGGGHVRAAGFRLDEDVDSLQRRVVAEFEKEFARASE